MASPSQPLRLEVDGLVAGYGRAQVVHGLSFAVRPGEVLALLGRNGMGKTTTLMAVAGALRPFAGRILVDGSRTDGLAPHKIARLGVSLVPQGRRVFESLSVLENLRFGARDASLDEVCEIFPVLRAKAHHRGSALSGGEQQMLAIGRALMTKPSLLLMDEPSEGLAPSVVRMIGERIHALRHELGQSIVIAEQNLGLALAVADRVMVMEQGVVVHEADTPAFARDKPLQHRLLGV